MSTSQEIFDSKMNALANSINAKAGSVGAKNLDELKTAVDSISVGVDTSDATATAGDILSGYSAYGSAGTKLNGTYVPPIRPDYLISLGDTVSTFYFNTEYDLDSFLASLDYSLTDPTTHLHICALGLGYFYAVDLTNDEYALVWNDGVNIVPLYSTTPYPSYGVTDAGWQLSSHSPSSSVTVSYILPAFKLMMDEVVASSDIAFGEHGSSGSQPQLNAPTISLSQMILSITNPSTNGNFVTGYKILIDGVETYTTSSTSYDLSVILGDTATITVKAVGTNFVDSSVSNSATFYRYFTVSMYDNDQTTLLSTESVRYGLMPSYTPTKSGYVFEYWNDINGNKVTQIISDINLYAEWSSVGNFILAGQYTVRSTSPTTYLDNSVTFNYITNFGTASTGVSIDKTYMTSPLKWFLINNPNKQGTGLTAQNLAYANISGTPSTVTWNKTSVIPITVETNQEVTSLELALFNDLFEVVS